MEVLYEKVLMVISTHIIIPADDRLVLNVKNVDIFMNPAQGLGHDVWYMSRTYNFPIPEEGLKYVAPTYL